MVVAPAVRRKGGGIDSKLVAAKLSIAPPVTVISLAAKLVVALLEVKVTVRVASLVVSLLATALVPSEAVITMIGLTPS